MACPRVRTVLTKPPAIVKDNRGDQAAWQQIEFVVANLATERHTPLQLSQ